MSSASPMDNLIFKSKKKKQHKKKKGKNQDAINEYVNGDKEKAKEMIQENYDKIIGDEGTELLNGIKNTMDESIKNSKGMVR